MSVDREALKKLATEMNYGREWAQGKVGCWKSSVLELKNEDELANDPYEDGANVVVLDADSPELAAYIAAVSPTVVLALLNELEQARDAATRLWVMSIPPSDLALKLWSAEWLDNPTPEMKEWMASYEQAYGDVRGLLRAGEE